MTKHCNVTFHFPIVNKIYSKFLKKIEWPKIPFAVMDIGCGSGRILLDILEPLLPGNYSQILGTDYNEAMINYCKTLEVHPKINFEVMSIESESIPKKFEKSFDFLFSSFVLHYVKDIRQTLINCSTLMKPNGELVFIYLYTCHPLYETYRRMCSTEEWRPYTKDFINYTPFVGTDNPIDETRSMFQNCGLEVLNIELNHDPYESTAESFLELFASVDMIYPKIPKEMKEKYEKDFSEIFSDIAGFSLAEQDLKKNVHMYFPAIVVHARNSP